MSEKLMTPKAIAAITGFHARTVSKMGRRGDIPGALFFGRHVRFRPQSVHDFLQDGSAPRIRADEARPAGGPDAAEPEVLST